MMSVKVAFLPIVFGIILWYASTNLSKHSSLQSVKLNDTYDYVIVGGGAAGSVLANRLSEDPNVSVLLLEAGTDYQDEMYDVPWNAPSAQMTEADWGFYSTPQKHGCQGMKEQRQYIPRGKGLGGSTLVNGLVLIRGSRFDFDGWSENGCTGWSYDEVLPYFKKFEDVRIDEIKDSVYRGTGGPMIISDTATTKITTSFLEAGEELGYKTHDPNANNGWQKGLARMQAIVGNGIRWHTARGYLYPILHRPNLHIAVQSHVTKVLITDKKAVGVVFIRNGRKLIVGANREVVLSAGVIGSPQILMLSGIGPADHLNKLQIPFVHDLPVGDNLQDHVMFMIKADVNQSVSLTPDKVNTYYNWLQYKLFGTGILATNAAVEAYAWFCSDPKDQSASFHCPDLQMIMFASLAEHADAYDHFNYDDQVAKELYSDVFTKDGGFPEGFTVCLQSTHPKSVGKLRLQSTDPFDYPLIDIRYLEHDYDVQPIVRGVKIFKNMLKTKTMQKLGAKLRNKPFSKCSQHTYDSDAYWECLVRHNAVSGYHQSSTCKMGSPSDKTAVVGPDLRVKGIQQLRVIDASIFPHVTSGNTMATTIMVAEKGADLIKKELK